MKRVNSIVILAFIIMSILTFPTDIQLTYAWKGTIYIKADGSIEPLYAPISTVDGITYKLTGNIYSDANGIIVERSNTILDG
jgi:hypothetical protein